MVVTVLTPDKFTLAPGMLVYVPVYHTEKGWIVERKVVGALKATDDGVIRKVEYQDGPDSSGQSERSIGECYAMKHFANNQANWLRSMFDPRYI